MVKDHTRLAITATCAMAFALGFASPAPADVFVIANRQAQTVRFSVPDRANPGAQLKYELPAGRSVVVRGIGSQTFTYQSEIGSVRAELTPNSVYAFDVTSDSRLMLKQVDLGVDESTSRGTGAMRLENLLSAAEIPIRIFVDDDEPATRALWEERLRYRVALASKVLEQNCRLRLTIVETGTWLSDNRLTSFDDAFQEFANQVPLGNARLAIGFASQFPIADKPGRGGVSSGVLRGHILMREGGRRRATEAEMAEALLQEIARTLGAVNQPIRESVMRPEMLDGQARQKSFELQFDPVNLLLINLLAEEIRSGDAHRLADLQPGTRDRLKQIYRRLGLAPKPSPEAEVATPADEPPRSVPANSTAMMTPKTDASVAEPTQPRQRATSHPDLAKLQGDWKIVSAQRRGQAMPEALLYKPKLAEDKLVLSAAGLGEFRFRMDIDPEDISSNAAPSPAGKAVVPFNLVMRIQDKDYIAQGIYELDGRRLRICIARPGKARPTSFASPEDVDQALLVIQRPAE